MNWVDRDRLQSEVLAGTFLNMGLATAVEIAAQTGFDWLLFDFEHESGYLGDLRAHLLAASHSIVKHVVAACQRQGETAGILSRPELVRSHIEMGFRFMALGSDGGAVSAGMQSSLKLLRGRE